MHLLKGFRPEIEGLRAIAVLLVVLFHAGMPLISGGFVGVDVFFVISGFLITRLLLAEILTDGRIQLSRFYLRRARRLLPALAVVVITTLLLSRAYSSPLEASNIAVDGIWASTYLINFHFLAGGLDYFASEQPDSPLLHLWSLAVEEQFYLLWPALLMVFNISARNRRIRSITVATFALTAASLVASVIITNINDVVAYFLPVTRGWELFAGALIAVAIQHLDRIPARVATAMPWLGLAAIAYAALTLDSTTPFPGSAAILPVAGTMAVIAGTRPGSRTQALLALPALQHIGARSYSLYLWHWPLLVIAADAFDRDLPLWGATTVVAASYAFASLTYRYIENPIRRSRTLVSSRKAGTAVAALMTFVPIALGSWLFLNPVAVPVGKAVAAAPDLSSSHNLSTFRSQTMSIRKAVAAGASLTTIPENVEPPIDQARSDTTAIYTDGCHQRTYTDSGPSPSCTYGDTTSKHTVVAFGDSHMAHWFPALEPISRKHGWRLVSLTRGACPSLAVRDLHRPVECDDWRESSITRIHQEKPFLVVLSNRQQIALARAGEALASVIEDIHEASPDSRVVVIEDVPRHDRPVPACLARKAREHRSVQLCAERRSAEVDAISAAMKAAASQSGAGWIDTKTWFCTESTCPPLIGNVVVLMDRTHMTLPMTHLLRPLLEARLLQVARSRPTAVSSE